MGAFVGALLATMQVPPKSSHELYSHELATMQRNSLYSHELYSHELAPMQRNSLVLRGDVAVTLMTMAISESLIRCLDPSFDVVAAALPYFVRFRRWSGEG